MCNFSKSINIPLQSDLIKTSGREAHEEAKDAISPIFDEMKVHPLWKVLEFIPCEFCPIIQVGW